MPSVCGAFRESFKINGVLRNQQFTALHLHVTSEVKKESNTIDGVVRYQTDLSCEGYEKSLNLLTYDGVIVKKAIPFIRLRSYMFR